MELSEFKDIATIAKPFIDPIIKAIIEPKVDQLREWLKKEKLNDKIVANYFEDKFEEFLLRTYKVCSNMNILVFPNQQIEIKEIYQPLSIRSSKNFNQYKIDVFREEYIQPHKKILISDSAGMGKSTLLKWIAISIIEQGLSIPVLIELKKINEEHRILDEIFSQLNPIDKSFDQDLITKFLEMGSFTILLDGFDEIEIGERENVIADIKKLVSKANENWFILTSRPDSELTSFGEFQLFTIVPLSKDEAFLLIDKYDQINNNYLSDKLKLNIEEKSQQVEEFLSNPFLVSLLYKTYTYNKDIPSKKSTFYEEVYYALYKHHDLSKDGYKRNKKSGLDIHDFRIVLRMLAFESAKQNKVEYTDVQLIEFLKDVNRKLSEVKFKELSYIEDLELNVPLFVRDGNLLKWAHRSVQDYFAAEFICSHEQKSTILLRIYETKKSSFLQILDFVSELEPQVFKETVIYELLKKYVFYCDNSYQSIKLDQKLIRKRQAVSFGVLYGIQQGDVTEPWLNRLDSDIDELGEFSIQFVYFFDNSKGPVTEIFATSFNQDLINIIGRKNFSFSVVIDSDDKDDLLHFELPDDEMALVNDSKDNIFNQAENFELVSNHILAKAFRSRTSYRMYLLDYERCVAEIENIEQQLKLRAENDILFGI